MSDPYHSTSANLISQQITQKMKKKVVYSTYCWVMTSLVNAMLIGMIFYFSRHGDKWISYLFLGCLCALIAGVVFYAPISVTAGNRAVRIKRMIRSTALPYSEIKSVRLCPPTMGEKRLFGSGGILGYWGWFSERDLGRYFAYYGKASDCFLVTMSDGRKYMVGCEDAPQMVDYINSVRDSLRNRP